MTDSPGSKLVKPAGRKPPNAGKGRKKGSLNKVTASVKEALTQAFDGVGGVDSLIAWGREDPAAFYALWSRMLPHEVNHSGVNPLADMLRAAEERLARGE